jgi:hypothetical protein
MTQLYVDFKLTQKEIKAMSRTKQNAGARSNFQNQILGAVESVQGTLSAVHNLIGKEFKITDTRGNQRNDNVFTRLNMLDTLIVSQFQRTRRGIAVVGCGVGIVLVNEIIRWFIR